MHALVRREAAGSPSVWLNVHDSSTTHNPRSHSDHYHAGQLADAVATLEPCVGRALYRDYATASEPANLGSNDLINKVAAWGATNSALVDLGFASTHDSGHNAWLPRSYRRTLDGRSPCTF